MLSEEKTSVDGLTLNVAAGAESGEPLLLIHGVLRRWQDFTPLIPGLAPWWHVHAMDLRGHGLSDRRKGEYRVADYARDVARLLEARWKEPVILYGHSLGAMVAAAVASAAPRRVRAVVLEDPPFDTLGSRIRYTPFHAFFGGVREALREGPGSVESLTRKLSEILVPIPGPDGTISEQRARLRDLRDATSLAFSARCLVDVDPDVLEPIVDGRWLEGYDVEATLQAIECPALLLQADYAAGGMLPDAEAARAAGFLRRGMLVKVPRVGHMIHWLDTAAALRFAVGFLQSL